MNKDKELWEIKLFKPSGKWYMNLDDEIVESSSLYTKLIPIVKEKYEEYIKDGFHILLKHNDGTIEGGLTHLIIGDKK
jgi:hypothetical protein